jgi:hypothetical protein
MVIVKCRVHILADKECIRDNLKSHLFYKNFQGWKKVIGKFLFPTKSFDRMLVRALY